jgi:CheY-like chemotaxis protein
MKNKRLLLIDDDEDDQELFIDALQGIDPSISCKVFDNALDALDDLDRNAYDLIVLDLNMPLMNGSQFLEKIKSDEHMRDIPVIIFSTTSNRFMLDQTAALGARAYYTKPSSYNDLISLLSNIVKTA